jgi:hypothetical protein
VTHLCIALSNFLHSRYLSGTAYLEVNAGNEIRALSNEQDPSAPFRHQGVVFYPDLTIRQLSEVKQKRYRYFILDFGRPTPHTLLEFAHCDHRIVLTDSAAWKSAELDRFAIELQKNNIAWDTCKTVCMRGKKSDFAHLNRTYGIRVISAPELRDPFHLTSEVFPFFEKLMKGE